MEPITLCGAVIVAIGFWVECESVIMKVAKAISKSTIMTALLSTTKEQRVGGVVSTRVCRSYRAGGGLTYRVARS